MAKQNKKKEKKGESNLKLVAKNLGLIVPSKIERKINLFTTQDSIPITGVYDKYDLIETIPGTYTKQYSLGQINYQMLSEEEQETIFLKYRAFLNSIGNSTKASITINNKNIDMSKFMEENYIKEVGDGLDEYRRELNVINTDRISEGKNGISKNIYLTLSITAETVEKADALFRRMDKEILSSFDSMKSPIKIIKLEDRLEILHDIYNLGHEGEFLLRTRTRDEENKIVEISSFDLNNIRSMGVSINNMISPSSIIYEDRYIELGEKFARAIYISDVPNPLSDKFFSELTTVDFNMLTSLNISPIPAQEATSLVATNISLNNSQIAKAQKDAIKNNFSPDMIPDNLKFRERELADLNEDITVNGEHLFEATLVCTIFADSLNELDDYTSSVLTVCKKSDVKADILLTLQEDGFNASLPLCYDNVPYSRTLTSSAAAAFMPFSVLDVNDKDGIVYSLNALSKNLLKYDRLSAQNFNGFILGTPGSGKSFAAKTEMGSVFLSTNAQVIVIDPEDEYQYLAKALNGEVVKISADTQTYINPMDINIDYDDDEKMDNITDINLKWDSAVRAKSNFLLNIYETMYDSPLGVDAVERTILDECVTAIYSQLLKLPPEQRTRENMPTLKDLQRVLASHPEPEARKLAMVFKLYSFGSLDTFAHHTNVDADNRFIVYNIKDVQDNVKPLAMLTILDSAWNTICANRKKGINTWLYIDEIYILFQSETSAKFLDVLFRRARKYGGVPTGITQNVKPLLESPTARDMLANCNFIEMLNQAASDREVLREILQLSQSQLDYVTSSPKGQGLLFTGKNAIPFASTFPKDTKFYKLITSDMKERKAIENEKKKQQLKEKFNK